MTPRWKAALLVALAVVAMVSVMVLLRGCGPTVDPQVEEERRQDSLRVVEAEAENARLLAVVDSVQRALRDTAAVHRARQGRLLGSANRLRDSIDVLEAAALVPGLDSAGQPVTTTDSAALTASCATRYRLRTAEADSLRGALTECDAKATADSTRVEITSDSLSTAVGRLRRALAQSDSARRREIARPKGDDCRLVFIAVPCPVIGVGGSINPDPSHLDPRVTVGVYVPVKRIRVRL